MWWVVPLNAFIAGLNLFLFVFGWGEFSRWSSALNAGTALFATILTLKMKD